MKKVSVSLNSKIASRKNQTGGGLKVGTGKFREPTSVLRIPSSQGPVIRDFLVAYQRKRLSANRNYWRNKFWDLGSGNRFVYAAIL